MQNAVKCPCCGLEEPVRDGGSTKLEEIASYSCDGCAVRIIYGRIMPKIVVEPARGERDFLWARVRVQDPKTREDLYVIDLDPKLAVDFARNLLSIVRL